MTKKFTEEEIKKLEEKNREEILEKFCHTNGCFGHYMQHHEFPHKYVKCVICGHTKELKKKS